MPLYSQSLPIASLHQTLAPDLYASPRGFPLSSRRFLESYLKRSGDLSRSRAEPTVHFRWRNRGTKVFSVGDGLSSSIGTSSYGSLKKRSIVEHIFLLSAKADLSEAEEKDMLDHLYTSQYQMNGIIAISIGVPGSPQPMLRKLGEVDLNRPTGALRKLCNLPDATLDESSNRFEVMMSALLKLNNRLFKKAGEREAAAKITRLNALLEEANDERAKLSAELSSSQQSTRDEAYMKKKMEAKYVAANKKLQSLKNRFFKVENLAFKRNEEIKQLKAAAAKREEAYALEIEQLNVDLASYKLTVEKAVEALMLAHNSVAQSSKASVASKVRGGSDGDRSRAPSVAKP